MTKQTSLTRSQMDDLVSALEAKFIENGVPVENSTDMGNMSSGAHLDFGTYTGDEDDDAIMVGFGGYDGSTDSPATQVWWFWGFKDQEIIEVTDMGADADMETVYQWAMDMLTKTGAPVVMDHHTD